MTLDFAEVKAEGLGRHYGRRNALAHVSFSCRSGEILGLLGPNGAGKSTLLSILATLLAPSTGTVRYGAHTAREAGAALRERLGLLGHDLFLYPELTARENLRFFASLYGVADSEARVETCLAAARLTDRGDDQVGGFSRGMRQRLALERALVHSPRLVLLDEPFTGLDQTSTASLVARLRDLQGSGCMVIVATHDLDVAENLFSRVLFLRNGRIAQLEEGGSDLRRRYQTALTRA